VTDEERELHVPRLRARATMRTQTSGSARRLAPLVANDRRQIELMNALLMSLPGTPVLYYGDEIAWGTRLPRDRNGVRTPMQWSPDRNRGLQFLQGTALLPTVTSLKTHVFAGKDDVLDPLHARDFPRRRACTTHSSAALSARVSSVPREP